MNSLDWNNNRSFRLISLYRDKPILWDPSHPDFKLFKKKNGVWRQLAQTMKADIQVVRRKMESLLASFRRERLREGNDEMYRSRWFAYPAMQFLNEKFKSKTPKYAENTKTVNDVELDDDNISVLLSNEEISFNDESIIISEQTISGLDTSKEQNINKRKSFGLVDNKPVTKIFKKARHTQYDTAKDLAIKKTNLSVAESNACDAFGKYIASELKTFDTFNLAQITHVFNNVLYEAHMCKFKQHITQQQSILNWNQNGTSETLVHPFTRQQFHQQSTPQQDIHNIPPGIILQQSSPQQYPSPTSSMTQQSSPQRYPTSSMTHHPDHNDINKMFTPQLKVDYSSDSSLSSQYTVFTD